MSRSSVGRSRGAATGARRVPACRWFLRFGAIAAIALTAAPGVSLAALPAQEGAPAGDAPAVRSPSETIEAQLAAFNAGDIDALAANVAPDFAWIAVDSSGTTVELAGREQFRRSMEGYFAGVYEPRAEIDDMVVSGDFVAVREVAYWQDAEGELSAATLAVYEVRDGLIYRVWYYPAAP